MRYLKHISEPAEVKTYKRIHKKNNLCITYDDMIGVCSGGRDFQDNIRKHCDASRGDKDITVNPYDISQMKTIVYYTDGTIGSTDPYVDYDINQVLNLNNSGTFLKENRKDFYVKLRDYLIKQRPNGNWDRSFIDKARKKFCSMQKEGDFLEFVGVYEYWLNKWEKRF